MTSSTMPVQVKRRTGLPRRLSGLRWWVSASSLICVVLVIAAVFAPIIAPHDPLAVDQLQPNAGSSAAHLLGTDDFGRDLLSRLIYGARYSLLGPALVVSMAVVAGVAIAFAAAWCGGLVDTVITRLIDVVLSFPGVILVIAVATIFGAGFYPPVFALAFAYSAAIARVLRTVVMRERRMPYIAALEIQGASTARIWVLHLLPNIAPIIVVQAAVYYGYAMLDLAGISFLGLGVQAPASEWGLMAASGQNSIVAGFPQESLYAALTIVVAVVAFNVLGERIARRFELEEFA